MPVSDPVRSDPSPLGASLGSRRCVLGIKRCVLWSDNAVVESFFGTLKLELDLDSVIGTRAFTKGVVFEWIEVFYNRQRLHSTLGFKSPVEFEQLWSRDQMPNFLSTKA